MDMDSEELEILELRADGSWSLTKRRKIACRLPPYSRDEEVETMNLVRVNDLEFHSWVDGNEPTGMFGETIPDFSWLDFFMNGQLFRGPAKDGVEPAFENVEECVVCASLFSLSRGFLFDGKPICSSMCLQDRTSGE